MPDERESRFDQSVSQERELISFSEEDLPEVRRVMYKRENSDGAKEEWYWSVVDIIGVLGVSSNPKEYWKKMKQRAKSDGFEEMLHQIVQIPLKAKNGRFHATDCANRQTLLLLVQSINSPRVEYIKIWLAKTGEETLKQAEEIEADIKRVENDLREKGYNEKYIVNYIRLKLIRNELTDTWKERGAQEGQQFAILTNTMHTHAFGLSIKQHREHKRLPKNADFRKNLTIGEVGVLAFTEATGIELHEARDSHGFDELHQDAVDAGDAGKEARLIAERTIGKSIVSPENNLHLLKKPDAEQQKGKGKKQLQLPLPNQQSLRDFTTNPQTSDEC